MAINAQLAKLAKLMENNVMSKYLLSLNHFHCCELQIARNKF